jgi:hypothetical protein
VIAPESSRLREVEHALIEGRWPLRSRAARERADAVPATPRHLARALDLAEDVVSAADGPILRHRS